MDIWEDKISKLIPGTVIPKPRSNRQTIERFDIRNNENALIYRVPPGPRSKTGKASPKAVTESEWRLAYEQLCSSGYLTRIWCDNHLPYAKSQGGCNFKFIGGVFELLGYAQYLGENSAMFELTPK